MTQKKIKHFYLNIYENNNSNYINIRANKKTEYNYLKTYYKNENLTFLALKRYMKKNKNISHIFIKNNINNNSFKIDNKTIKKLYKNIR
jgi:hypothetical protein